MSNPQNCAFVRNSDNKVINVIVADPTVDVAPEGYAIIALPAESPVTFDWVYDPITQQFSDQNQPTS